MDVHSTAVKNPWIDYLGGPAYLLSSSPGRRISAPLPKRSDEDLGSEKATLPKGCALLLIILQKNSFLPRFLPPKILGLPYLLLGIFPM